MTDPIDLMILFLFGQNIFMDLLICDDSLSRMDRKDPETFFSQSTPTRVH